MAYPASQQFKAAYAAQAKKMYSGEFTMDYYAANSYDAVYMIAEAIQKAGVQNKPDSLEADREKVMKNVRSARLQEGVASRGFNDDGEYGVKADVLIAEAKGGHWVLTTGSR